MIIGLTGGISSGKSTVSALFHELKVPIIIADDITRELVQPGTSAYNAITKYFGNNILQQNGSLNRNILRQIIFSNPTARIWIENLLHPLVCQRILQQAKSSSAPYCIAEIPLLLESNTPIPVDRILIVDCSEGQQIIRTTKRDNVAQQEVEKIIAIQISRQNRLAAADDVIFNNDSIEHLTQQVQDLHNKYLELCN